MNQGFTSKASGTSLKMRLCSGQIGLSFIHGLILVTAVLFLLGHILHHSPPYLNPFNNYISQYAVSASSRVYIQWTIIFTSAIIFTLSFALLRRFQNAHIVQASCLIMIIAATCLVFVGIYPTEPVQNPPYIQQGFHPLDSLWNWLHRPPADPKNDEKVEATIKAFSSVHNTMIGTAMKCMCGCMVLLGIYFVKLPGWRNLGWWSFGMVLVSAILLIGGGKIMPSVPGLWQRLGFLIVFIWMWLVVDGLKKAKDAGSGVNSSEIQLT